MANGLFGGGNGTSASPFLIEDLLDFIAMIRQAPSYDNYFKVVNDIDASLESLEAVGLGNGGNGWVCIPFGFQVYVDFNFKKLSNLYMKTDGLACPFGDVNGLFKNFIFENFDITSTSGDAFGLFSGSSQFSLNNGKISGFKVKAEKNASLISGVAKRHYFQGIYIDNSHVESKEKASFFISETVIVLNDSSRNIVQFNVISNSSLKSKICRGLGDGKGSMTWVPGGDEPCFNRSNLFLNCKFMGTEINTVTDFLPYGQTAVKIYEGSDGVLSSIFSFGSTFEGPHSDELYKVAYLTETQAKTASTYGKAFNNNLTKIVAEDGSFPYFYLDTSPTFPAEVKTETGKDGSTVEPIKLNTAIAYALDFNNWWIIDEGLSTPYKPSFYVKDVGSVFPLPAKILTGKDGLDISLEAALAEISFFPDFNDGSKFPQAEKILTSKDGEDITQEATLEEISYALDFNNWWIIDEGLSAPYKPSFYVKDVGSCVPLPVKSLTGKDGEDISIEAALEEVSSIDFSGGSTFLQAEKILTGKDGLDITQEAALKEISYALDFNNWWITDSDTKTPYKPSFYVKEVGSTFPEAEKSLTGKDGLDISLEAALEEISYYLYFNDGSTFPQAEKILTGKDGENITPEATLEEISYALDFNNWWIIDEGLSTPYKPSFYVKDVGSCVPLPVKSLTGKDGLDMSESDACKKATYAFDWNDTPFIMEDGLSSPSMDYFSGGVVIEILSGKFSKSFETGIKASVFETIVYTTDGTDPSKTSKVLSNGDKVKVSESCVLKARTFDSVFIGGQYCDFLSEISKETYVISPFKSVFEELMSKVKFEPHSEVDSYIDKDSDGNRMVRIVKNVDQILTVYRNEEEISEYFCDEEMVDYDFDDSEELVYYFYKEDGEFLCKSIPSEIASNKDVDGEVMSEVSDMFLELYNSYEDLTVLKDYIKGYKNIYEFINSVVKLKKIKECIDEDLPKLDNLIEVKSSLESRINKFSKMKNIVQGSFYVNLEEIPEMVNHSENILANIGVETSSG